MADTILRITHVCCAEAKRQGQVFRDSPYDCRFLVTRRFSACYQNLAQTGLIKHHVGPKRNTTVST